jgi:2-C-methyl-D-erythritol 4-phosphate cytidylyltransferase
VAVVVAAGRGERLGAPKQFLPLGGVPIVEWSCRALLSHPGIEHVVVVLPPDGLPDPERSSEWLSAPGVRWCPGGASRRESAGLGVRAAPGWADLILIHDAARPFVSAGTIDAVLAAAAETGAALPTLPVSDTVKRVRDARVQETLDRAGLGRAQTPQGFRASLIRAVHDWASREEVEAPDDAFLCELRGHEVAAVPGDPQNLKVTTPFDLALAEWLVESGRMRLPGGEGLWRGSV